MATKIQKVPSNAVWFVTGCSSGIGKALAEHILKHGHRVVATARRISALDILPSSDKLLKVSLDVTSNEQIDAAFEKAVQVFGRVDVVINNAGYSIFGEVESTPEDLARQCFETNFWGAVRVTRTALRIMREVNPQGEGGTIVNISSVGGFVGAPGLYAYQSSKFALEGFTEVVSKEVHPSWNIKFIIIEPGAVKSEWSATMDGLTIKQHPAYTGADMGANQLQAYRKAAGTSHSAEATDVAEIIFRVVKAGNAPFRLPIGADAWGLVMSKLQSVTDDMEKWKDVCNSTTLNDSETVQNKLELIGKLI